VDVCAPESVCAQAPDTGSATVPSINASTPKCDTRTKLPLWGNLCAGFAIGLVILAPHSHRSGYGESLNRVRKCANRQKRKVISHFVQETEGFLYIKIKTLPPDCFV
jgi:hypothetical protein